MQSNVVPFEKPIAVERDKKNEEVVLRARDKNFKYQRINAIGTVSIAIATICGSATGGIALYKLGAMEDKLNKVHDSVFILHPALKISNEKNHQPKKSIPLEILNPLSFKTNTPTKTIETRFGNEGQKHSLSLLSTTRHSRRAIDEIINPHTQKISKLKIKRESGERPATETNFPKQRLISSQKKIPPPIEHDRVPFNET